MTSNRPLADRLGDALIEAAEAKAEAFKLERLFKATLRACTLASTAKSWNEREAMGSQMEQAKVAEQQWIEAEMKATVTKAKAGALEYQFEAWRTERATERAQMQLR